MAEALQALGPLALRQHHGHALPALGQYGFQVCLRNSGVAYHQHAAVQVDQLPHARKAALLDNDVIAAHAKAHRQFHTHILTPAFFCAALCAAENCFPAVLPCRLAVIYAKHTHGPAHAGQRVQQLFRFFRRKVAHDLHIKIIFPRHIGHGTAFDALQIEAHRTDELHHTGQPAAGGPQ